MRLITRRSALAGLSAAALAPAVALTPAQQIVILGTTGLSAEALAYRANIAAAGSSISAVQLAAVNAFIVGCKADGVWTKLKDVGTFTGANLTAALVKIKGLHATSYVNSNFVSGDYTLTTGLKGNGTTKSLATGVVPSVDLTIHSTHLALYDRSLITGTIHAAGAGETTASFDIYHPYSDRKLYSDQYNNSTAEIGSAAQVDSTPVGFIVGTKTAATAHVLYKDGASVASGSTNAGSLPAVEVTVFARNAPGPAPTEFSTHYLSFFSVGDGLSAGDVTALTARVQTLQHALSRSPAYVAFEGDSIISGNGTTTSYATQAGTTLGQPPLFADLWAVASSTITGGAPSLAARAAAVDAAYSTALYRKNVLVVACGHNDRASGAATAFAAYKAYCQARRAVGYKVIAVTLLPSTVGGFNTPYRDTFNASVRGDTSFYDALCDLGADATMGPDAAASDTLLYGDGVHPTQAGHDALAAPFLASLTPFV